MKRLRPTKNQYLTGFMAVTFVLAIVRCVFPEVARPSKSAIDVAQPKAVDTPTVDSSSMSALVQPEEPQPESGRFFSGKHPIQRVSSFRDEFPDSQAVQIVAANTYGVQAVQNRDDAEDRKNELVFVGSNPYYQVAALSSSIPYLVPRAAVLLQDIGRNFFDSLQVKHIPLSRMVVTSVLRSKDDVARLRTHNRNATENSCHLYGTTFDVSYTRFQMVPDMAGKIQREVQSDTLKYVLGEVLRDLRNQQRCYVKYEVKQSCFHITVR